jgi:hypothetical protein
MTLPDDDTNDIDATEDQLAELAALGISQADLEGLSSADAEEWIDELRQQRIDAGKFDKPKAAKKGRNKP